MGLETRGGGGGMTMIWPTMGMVAEERAQVGLMMIGKAAMSRGMSNLVFVFYSNALASLVLLPISLIFHRMEGMDLRKPSSVAKSAGTIVSVAGALMSFVP